MISLQRDGSRAQFSSASGPRFNGIQRDVEEAARHHEIYCPAPRAAAGVRLVAASTNQPTGHCPVRLSSLSVSLSEPMLCCLIARSISP